MEIVDYLLARKKAGSDVTIEQLNVTENGTYSEQGIAYSPVVVNVPAPENSYQLTDIPTGAVSTIEDGTDLPMSSLKVGIEPVQDLHGYDHPWVGGAGKNLFHMGSKVNATISNVTYTSDDEFITLNGTKQGGGYADLSSLQLTLPAGTYYLKAIIVSGDTSNTVELYAYDGSANITSSLIGTERTLTLELEKTFWFRIAIWQDGTVLNNYKIGIVISNTANIGKFYPYSNICPISGWTAANVSVSPTTSSEDGTTYTIQFKDGDNPLTVYGGTLDVTTGELVVDRAGVNLGIFSWTGSNYRFNTTISFQNVKAGTHADCICSQYKPDVGASTRTSDFSICFANNGYCYIYDTSFTGTVTEFRTAMNGVQLVYELATPLTYHLTPTQVRTLVGNNNIWADTGDIIEGKYFRSLT